MYVRLCVFMLECLYVCLSLCSCACVSMCLYVCVSVCLCLSVSVCAWVCSCDRGRRRIKYKFFLGLTLSVFHHQISLLWWFYDEIWSTHVKWHDRWSKVDKFKKCQRLSKAKQSRYLYPRFCVRVTYLSSTMHSYKIWVSQYWWLMNISKLH